MIAAIQFVEAFSLCEVKFEKQICSLYNEYSNLDMCVPNWTPILMCEQHC